MSWLFNLGRPSGPGRIRAGKQGTRGWVQIELKKRTFLPHKQKTSDADAKNAMWKGGNWELDLPVSFDVVEPENHYLIISTFSAMDVRACVYKTVGSLRSR